MIRLSFYKRGGRKFILFSKIFWPQDFLFLLGMITFIIVIDLIVLSLFMVDYFVIWVCPQTVFLELVFRPIEWLASKWLSKSAEEAQ
ncbi:MAG: hypothetical protein IPJ43_17945 [Saprospiraceae bacterium]|nr:hypothetical protein [Saprospiraceae bacterium]